MKEKIKKNKEKIKKSKEKLAKLFNVSTTKLHRKKLKNNGVIDKYFIGTKVCEAYCVDIKTFNNLIPLLTFYYQQ